MKDPFLKKFIIGGAQLGMRYGDKRNKLYENKSEQKKILSLAKKLGLIKSIPLKNMAIQKKI